ncbi:hypothetical protein GCM10009557_66480 [Virgisporangium ochraceum]|uniref:Uncharacterized protein n=1 Tax=Virgisporangium ochraceum TaxID=65505 RepID=A0A8J4E8Z4_9ACTN|nr:hypothetical protein [Virgisporangium ochraceum]GIJ66221.1 hypothetical protein Voc01_011380 [Virgisporangium ochraceum]
MGHTAKRPSLRTTVIAAGATAAVLLEVAATITAGATSDLAEAAATLCLVAGVSWLMTHVRRAERAIDASRAERRQLFRAIGQRDDVEDDLAAEIRKQRRVLEAIGAKLDERTGAGYMDAYLAGAVDRLNREAG